MKINNVTWFWYDIEYETKLAYLAGGSNLITTAPILIVLYASNLIYIVIFETQLWFSIWQSWQSNKKLYLNYLFTVHITQCTMQTIALMYYADNTFNFKKVGAENSEFLVCLSVCQLAYFLTEIRQI